MNGLVNHDMISLSQMRVDVGKSAADGAVSLQAEGRVITLDIYRLFMIKQFEGSPPRTKVST